MSSSRAKPQTNVVTTRKLKKLQKPTMMDSIQKGLNRLSVSCTASPKELESVFGPPFFSDDATETTDESSTMSSGASIFWNSISSTLSMAPNLPSFAYGETCSNWTQEVSTRVTPQKHPTTQPQKQLSPQKGHYHSHSYHEHDQFLGDSTKETNKVVKAESNHARRRTTATASGNQDDDHNSRSRSSSSSDGYDEISVSSCEAEENWDYECDVDAYILDDDDDFTNQMEGYQDKPRFRRQEDTDYVDPPLSAQTSYARQQLLHSARYRQIVEEREAENLIIMQDDMLVDEAEIDRGLGGYAEGFDVPSMLHFLPNSIPEDDEDNGDEQNQEDKINNDYMKKLSSRAVVKGSSLGTVSTLDVTDKESNCSNVCYHCRKGTCDNADCSNSRFMI